MEVCHEEKKQKKNIMFFTWNDTNCMFNRCSTASKDEHVQTYAWPIATASPEDTVTQILAEKFAEE